METEEFERKREEGPRTYSVLVGVCADRACGTRPTVLAYYSLVIWLAFLGCEYLSFILDNYFLIQLGEFQLVVN